MTAWAWLALAILAEVTATMALKASGGWKLAAPLVLVVTGYSLAFYALSQVMRSVPVGVSYALWSGAGLVLVGLLDWGLHGQRLRLEQLGAMALILLGIVWLVLSTPEGTASSG
jgi:small multidrug resistance pump